MPSNRAGNATLERAAEATTKLKDEIDQLWFDSVTSEDGMVSERLAAVSHAIRRVFRVLDQEAVIG
jgi:hypothetical protein